MAPSKAAFPESDEDKKSKRQLRLFLEVNQQALEQLFEALRARLGAVEKETVERLNVLRVAAFEGQKGVLDFLRRGINSKQRKLLTQIGLFHESLTAKLELLWDCLGNGSLHPILKTLNSILGSLAELFAVLHAVKEFKEMMEVAIDRLGPDADPIVLKLASLPDLNS